MTEYIPGEYYHIYNRGVNRQPIFFCDRNWSFFTSKLATYFTSDKADIVAYCLMPNHYHLLVQVKGEDFSHHVMQPLSVSYTKAINMEQSRVGALFQGRFKGKRVETNEVLLHLSSYIHRNPPEAGLVRKPEGWAYSSYLDYVGLRKSRLTNPEVILGQFKSAGEYAEFVEGGGEYKRILEGYLLD